MTEHIQVLAVNGSNEGLSKCLVHLVLLLISVVLDLVHLVHHHLDLVGIIMLNALHQIYSCLFREGGTLRKVVEIKLITFSHFYNSFLSVEDH